MSLTCLLRRAYPAAELLAAHPPQISNPHKQRVFDRLCPADAVHGGTIEVTRWAPLVLPLLASLEPTAVAQLLTELLAASPAHEPLPALLARMAALDLRWGVGNGT